VREKPTSVNKFRRLLFRGCHVIHPVVVVVVIAVVVEVASKVYSVYEIVLNPFKFFYGKTFSSLFILGVAT
jgi:hypothetical protein